MNCKICNKSGAGRYVLKGPGKRPEAVYLCDKHRVGLKRWQANGGRQPLTSDELDARIDSWHNGDGEGQSIHEYLGWTWEQYKHWAETGELNG